MRAYLSCERASTVFGALPKVLNGHGVTNQINALKASMRNFYYLVIYICIIFSKQSYE